MNLKPKLPDGWQMHLFSYNFEGAEYSFEIPARSAEEAKRRVQALVWAKYDGELSFMLAIRPGLLTRFIEWVFGGTA